MLNSHQRTAPVTLTTRADVTDLVKTRDRLKTSRGASVVPSITDFIVKSTAQVLLGHRRLAGRWEGDRIEIPSDDDLHIGIAVDSEDGLLVPVIRHVNRLSLNELAELSRRLIDRARSGQLSAEEMHGSVFTISNLGGLGIDAFTPIINPPETAILGLGAIRRELVVNDDDTIAIRRMITLCLTFDHRVIDGAPAAQFLAELREVLQNF
jgi:pyruvate dehydrogenase E2 component (dihydrolipoamide acetyltransferase)